MWIFICIFIVTVIVILLFKIKNKPNIKSDNISQNNISYESQTMQPIKMIKDCDSFDDIQFHFSYHQQKIVRAVEKNKNYLKNAIFANIAINTQWLDSFEPIIRISNNLNSNLNFYIEKKLEISKFEYYKGLSIRSIVAADIVYKEYKKIEISFNEINNIILMMKNGDNINGVLESNIFQSKESIEELMKIYLERIEDMRHNTIAFRDKIGQECGECRI